MTTGSYMQVAKEVAPTLMARDYKDPTTVAPVPHLNEGVMGTVATGAHPSGFNGQDAFNDRLVIDNPEAQPTPVTYTVRRLTPTECARLQGFPDWWCRNLGIEDPTEEELAFWADVFETHRKIVTHAKKPKTEKQIRKWLADPYTDSAEYRICDNVPTRSFLQMTMGWFLKEKQLAMMQTPHHFFSPDPFERNLGRFRKTPNEGTLFYGLVQDGNDMWDATFFCGSCAVIRRKPLDEIGGIAVETVTEDAHTSLRLHRRGYTSAYMRIPQAAGLATESLSAHIGQRIRWARGMVQIFRLDNPLTGKGLKFAQRLCYVNAMFHFLSGIPRLIFLTAPLAFLLLHAYIIYAPALMIALFVLPHMIHASLTNSKIQGKYRHSFWSEIYETVLAWYIAPPTLVALINPHKGKFNVTAKGGLVEEEYVDWVISRPYIFLVLLNLVGVAVGIWRYFYGPPTEMLTVVVSMVWVFYNLIVLGGAVAVSVESKQVRRSHRVEMTMPAAIAREDGHLFSCTVQDFSDGGLGIKINGQAQILEGQKVNLLLKRGQQEYVFPTQVARVMGNEVGLKLMPLTTQQHIDFVQCTFARADTWALWQDSYPEDKPLESLLDILKLGFRGYRHLAEFAPSSVKGIFRVLTSLVSWVVSFIPRRPERSETAQPSDQALAQQ